MALQDRLAHHRCRSVDDLRPLVVGKGDEPECGERAVGAVGHRGVDPGGALGGGAQGRRRVAAAEGQKLRVGQPKTVGLLEGRQGRRAFDELGRSGELDLAAAVDPAGEIGHRRKTLAPRHIAAHGDRPGVVGRRRGEPNEAVAVTVERARPRHSPWPGPSRRGRFPGERRRRRCRCIRDRCRSGPARIAPRTIGVGPSCNLFSIGRSWARNTAMIMLPSSAPSVSIFEATTIFAPAAGGGCAAAGGMAARNRAKPSRAWLNRGKVGLAPDAMGGYCAPAPRPVSIPQAAVSAARPAQTNCRRVHLHR